jgi:hypothetical protein
MLMETLYVVQSFREVDGDLQPGKPVLHGMEQFARECGEQLAQWHPGVLVYAQRADTDRGEYATPVVLARYGRVPHPQVRGLHQALADQSD